MERNIHRSPHQGITLTRSNPLCTKTHKHSTTLLFQVLTQQFKIYDPFVLQKHHHHQPSLPPPPPLATAANCSSGSGHPLGAVRMKHHPPAREPRRSRKSHSREPSIPPPDSRGALERASLPGLAPPSPSLRSEHLFQHIQKYKHFYLACNRTPPGVNCNVRGDALPFYNYIDRRARVSG